MLIIAMGVMQLPVIFGDDFFVEEACKARILGALHEGVKKGSEKGDSGALLAQAVAVEMALLCMAGLGALDGQNECLAGRSAFQVQVGQVGRAGFCGFVGKAFGDVFFGVASFPQAFFCPAQVALAFLLAASKAGVSDDFGARYALYAVDQGVVGQCGGLQLAKELAQVAFAAEEADDAAQRAAFPVGGKADADTAFTGRQEAVQGLHDVGDAVALPHLGLGDGADVAVVAGHGLLLAAGAEYTATDEDADDVVLFFFRQDFVFFYPLVKEGIEVFFLPGLTESDAQGGNGTIGFSSDGEGRLLVVPGVNGANGVADFLAVHASFAVDGVEHFAFFRFAAVEDEFLRGIDFLAVTDLGAGFNIKENEGAAI